MGRMEKYHQLGEAPDSWESNCQVGLPKERNQFNDEERIRNQKYKKKKKSTLRVHISTQKFNKEEKVVLTSMKQNEFDSSEKTCFENGLGKVHTSTQNLKKGLEITPRRMDKSHQQCEAPENVSDKNSYFLRKNTNKLKKIITKIERHTIFTKKIRNRIKKSENGNQRNKMKIMLWNKGSKNYLKVLPIIKNTIKQDKPDIYVINEVELRHDQDIKLAKIEGYRMEHDSLREKGLSIRTLIYIKDNVNYTRLKKYELNMESTVTVSIGFHNQRRTILTGYYRQWADKLDGKRSIKKQESCLTNQMNL